MLLWSTQEPSRSWLFLLKRTRCFKQGDRQRPQRTEKTTLEMAREDPSKTLQDAVDEFLDSKRSLKEFTLTNYHRQVQNQVTDVIPTKIHLDKIPNQKHI